MFKKATFIVMIFCIGVGICITNVLMGKISIPLSVFSASQETIFPLKTPPIFLAFRSGIIKDIWIPQDNDKPLHFRMTSPHSELLITHQEGKFKIKEKLFNVQCLFQDKFFIKNHQLMQQLRYFQTSEGLYDYSTGQFTAQLTEIAFFRLPGFELPEKLPLDNPFLKGLAQNVYLSIKTFKPILQAQFFQASFKTDP